MYDRITRRLFFGRSAILGFGTLLGDGLGRSLWGRTHSTNGVQAGVKPLIATSHSNETGQRAMEAGWAIIADGGSALDAVEAATNIIEVDPDDTSVGYGGLPNELGVVQLDASIMDGATYSAGAVAALENIKTPSSVARLVMERTDHVMLVGAGALEFARSWGFVEENLLTEKARQRWLRWREEHSDRDDWGPPDHLKGTAKGEASLPWPLAETYGTVNVLAVDQQGNVAGITSTSGLSYKVPGRIGDSPIIGAGLYVDNEVGAAGATGRGEDVIKSCASYYIVLRMKEGRTPQQACEDALHMIAARYRAVGLDFLPGEKFVAINRAGQIGCATTSGDRRPRMTVRTADGLNPYEGIPVFGETGEAEG